MIFRWLKLLYVRPKHSPGCPIPRQNLQCRFHKRTKKLNLILKPFNNNGKTQTRARLSCESVGYDCPLFKSNNPHCLQLIKYEKSSRKWNQTHSGKIYGASHIREEPVCRATEHTLVLPCFLFSFFFFKFCDSNSIRQTFLQQSKQIKGPLVVEPHTSHLSLSHHRIHVTKHPCRQSGAANVLQHTIFKHTQCTEWAFLE